MSLLHKAIYTFNAIPIKIPTAFFIELEHNSKISIEPQKNLRSQRNLQKEQQTGGITILDFKLYYKAVVI